MSKAKSIIIAEKTIYAAFNILKEAGGEMRGKDVVNKIRETVEYYDELSDEQKNMLPLQPIYFLGSND